jgi:signal transduction histidine kinase
MHVLRAGFGGMLALLLLSGVEAYRIQTLANKETRQIYERHNQEFEQLVEVRQALYQASVDARDFFLSGQENPEIKYRRQLADSRTMAGRALTELQSLKGADRQSARLRAHVEEFFLILEDPLWWDPHTRLERGFKWDDREIDPVRTVAAGLLRNLALASDESFDRSQQEIVSSRRMTLARLLGTLLGGVILGLLLTRFILGYVGRLEAERARQFELVQQAKTDLELLSGRLLHIQEEERKRLSRELHDEIGQTLTALRIEISHAQAALRSGAPAAYDRLEEARSLTEKTVRTVRDISLLLRPSMLDDLGLSPALQYQTEEFARRTGIRCTYVDEGLDEESLTDMQKTCVYRVVQEALNNCQKHSAATAARVQISHTSEKLRVLIEDNGAGFEVDDEGNPAAGGGLGILGMTERVTLLHGRMTVESRPGHGTTILISLPARRGEPAGNSGGTKEQSYDEHHVG